MAAKFLLAATCMWPVICAESETPSWTISSSKIVGGEAALEGEFPYMVGLSWQGIHACGGSLLDPYSVLTAAHCTFLDVDTVQVRGGTLTWDTGGVQVNVSSYHIHPEYIRWDEGYDVAIWKLASPIQGDGIEYATLPPAGYDPPAGELVTVVGWGDQEYGSGEGSPVLLKVEIPVVAREVCGRQFPDQITDTMFCVGEEEGGKAGCQGDSGGPVVLADGTVVGIVSWGRECALPDTSEVIANVGMFIDFIKEHL